MSTKRLAIRGVAFNWLGRLCAFAIAFVVTPILIRGLGNEAYGIWSMAMSFTVYYALADLGLRGAGVKYISQFNAVDDRESVNKVVVTSLAVCALLALAAIFLAACVTMVLPLVLEADQESPGTVRWVVMLTGVSVSLAILGQVFGAALAAMSRFDLLNIVAVSTQVLQAALIVLALRMGGGLLAMAWIVLLVAAVAQLCSYVLAVRTLPGFSLSPGFFEWNTLRTLFRFGALNVGQGLARRVKQSAGTLIGGIILGPATVTFYVIAEGLTNKSAELSNGIKTVLMPVASHLDAQKRRSELAEVFLLASRALLALGIALGVIFFAVGWPLIDLWIGQGYAATVYPVLCLLSVAMVIRMTSNGARSVLRGMNRMGILTKIDLIDVVLTLTLGILLAKAAGIVGMAYAILLTEVVTAGVLVPVFACRTLNVPLNRFLWKAVVPGVAASCPGLMAALAIVALAPPSHIIHVIIQALCIVFVTGASIFLVCFEKEMRLDIVHSLLGRKRLSPTESTPVLEAKEHCPPEDLTSEDAGTVAT